MSDGWRSLSSSFGIIGELADRGYVQDLIDSGFVQHQPHGPVFKKQRVVRNKRSDRDSKLVVAIINLAVDEALKADKQYRSRGDLFAAAATQLPFWILNFSNMWQFSLGLRLDETFVRSLFWNMATSMWISPKQVIEKISSQPIVSQQLNGSENLYFAFGSNMNKSQMLMRTRSSRFLGWADLPNFEYFIDNRGVASVRPRIGKSVKGFMWDIQRESDWERLDRYEGVASKIYNKLRVDVAYQNTMVSSAIYISSTAAVGNPRADYQEDIISAVMSEYREATDLVAVRGDVDPEAFDNDFQFLFEDWGKELSGWIKA